MNLLWKVLGLLPVEIEHSNGLLPPCAPPTGAPLLPLQRPVFTSLVLSYHPFTFTLQPPTCTLLTTCLSNHVNQISDYLPAVYPRLYITILRPAGHHQHSPRLPAVNSPTSPPSLTKPTRPHPHSANATQTPFPSGNDPALV